MPKTIGPSFKAELDAAGCPGIAFTPSTGEIEVHDQQNYLVKITCEVGGSAVDVRTPDTGTHPQLDEVQIAAIKTILTDHDPAAYAPPDPAGFVAWILARFDFARQRVLKADQPNFYDYLQTGNWDGVRWCITDSATRGVLTAEEYADFQAAWTTYHLPGDAP